MSNSDFIKGVDISTIFEVVENGGKFFDFANGDSEEHRAQSEEVLSILKRYGINSVRIRLWNDPYSDDGKKYGAGTNDLKSTLELAKLAKDAGMSILYNFHYSDFWADPGKQIMPKAWVNLNKDELVNKVYEFTYDTMKALEANGTLPEYVQVGNELTNGLMWPVGRKPASPDEADGEYGNGYDNIAAFISAGIKAVKAVSPTTKIMIHLDNGGNNPMYRDWFDNYIKRGGEDFDIIGLSYYPFWHGTMAQLLYNMKDMAKRYGKELVVAEVSMGFTMEDYASYEKLPADKRKGMATRKELCEQLEYPMTIAGQQAFMDDFMNTVKSVEGGRGFYYWEPAWIPVPNVEWANEEALKYTGENGPGGNEWANQALFDYEGRALKTLRNIRDFK